MHRQARALAIGLDPGVDPVTTAPLEADDELYTRTNLRVLRNPTLVNFLDGAALSLPCHRPGEEAPVGLSLAVTYGQDATLLAIGLGVEAVLRDALRS